jgi:hypothetical protein
LIRRSCSMENVASGRTAIRAKAAIPLRASFPVVQRLADSAWQGRRAALKAKHGRPFLARAAETRDRPMHHNKHRPSNEGSG